MNISMRALFSRKDIAGKGTEAISLRNSLVNHPGVLQMSLRKSHEQFQKTIDGDGRARGCRVPHSIEIGIKIVPFGGGGNVGMLFPAWVPIGFMGKPSDHRFRPHTVEGILTKSKVTREDFPLKPWHTNYDWNFFVHVDPQYKYLLSEATRDHNKATINGKVIRNIMECEWDTAFVPISALPQEGDRVWIVGRWIYDCGHPEKKGYRTEIHPPKAIASFRMEATKLPGNSGPTRVNTAKVYIGRKGGYIDQAINDQDYSFDLYLPPKPHSSAVPKFTVSKLDNKTGPLPVKPLITPFPTHTPQALRITIPLKGVTPHPNECGAIISGGWSDPRGTEAKKIKRIKVVVEHFIKIGPLADFDWLVYVGVNGRWRLFPKLKARKNTLNMAVELFLHPEDKIRVTVCGFIIKNIHKLMGSPSGVSRSVVGNRNTLEEAKKAAKKIRNGLLAAAGSKGIPLSFGNIAIDLFREEHRPVKLATFNKKSKNNEYNLRYKIEEF